MKQRGWFLWDSQETIDNIWWYGASHSRKWSTHTPCTSDKWRQ